ncbi:hypothetical protein MCOR18_004313 [Pyricularia oryzae]|nr:hypothetical protein MCOR18_004313 [Pyricularia oryzae]
MNWPSPNAKPDAEVFFQSYLAAFIVIGLYVFWKVYSREWSLYVPLADIDLMSGARMAEPSDEPEEERTWKNLPKRVIKALF